MIDSVGAFDGSGMKGMTGFFFERLRYGAMVARMGVIARLEGVAIVQQTDNALKQI